MIFLKCILFTFLKIVFRITGKILLNFRFGLSKSNNSALQRIKFDKLVLCHQIRPYFLNFDTLECIRCILNAKNGTFLKFKNLKKTIGMVDIFFQHWTFDVWLTSYRFLKKGHFGYVLDKLFFLFFILCYGLLATNCPIIKVKIQKL